MTLLLVTSDQIGLTVMYEMRSVSNRKKPKTNPQKDKTLKFKLDHRNSYTLFLEKWVIDLPQIINKVKVSVISQAKGRC